jgi:hypothetical protein
MAMTKELETLATEAVFHLQFRTARAARMIVDALGVSEDVARKAVATVAKPCKSKK